MPKLLLVLLLFEAPWAAAGSGAEAGVSWVEENLRDCFLTSDLRPLTSKLPQALPAVGEGTSQALKLPLNGYVSVWSQDCPVADGARETADTSEPCAIPLPLVKNRAIAFELALPQAPGQAQPGSVKEIFSLPETGKLSLVLNFYAVCPYAAARFSGACPALYFQAQAELAGAAGAFCAAAFNEKDFAPFPVLMCGGDKTHGVRFGITLHRAKL